jgi:hypothetical protein
MTRPTRLSPTRSTYGQRSRFGLAWQLCLLAVLSLLAGGRCVAPAVAGWLEATARARTQRLEQAAEPAK